MSEVMYFYITWYFIFAINYIHTQLMKPMFADDCNVDILYIFKHQNHCYMPQSKDYYIPSLNNDKFDNNEFLSLRCPNLFCRLAWSWLNPAYITRHQTGHMVQRTVLPTQNLPTPHQNHPTSHTYRYRQIMMTLITGTTRLNRLKWNHVMIFRLFPTPRKTIMASMKSSRYHTRRNAIFLPQQWRNHKVLNLNSKLMDVILCNNIS